MAVTDGSNTPHASRDQLSQGRPNYSPSSYNNLFFNFVDRISSGMEGSSRDSSDNEKDIDVQKKPLETADVGSYNSKKKTQQMTSCMDDLSLRSPQKRGRASRSRSVSKRKTRSPSSSGSSCRSRSCSSRSASSHSRYSSCSTLHSRSRSRSRGYRGRRRRYRSRSYSRSRSRSPSRSYSRRYRSRGHRSRPRYRSRSRSYYRSRSRSRSRYHRRSHSRSRYHRRSRSRARSIGRRYYGFARRIYSPCYRRRSRTPSRSRSRSRSWSRSHLRLTEKDRKELLEIAKANAAKMLGKDDIELPESLKNDNSQKSTEVTVKTYTEKR